MDYMDSYNRWLAETDGTDTALELMSICGDAKEIESRFYADLSFGTAGLRGVMAAGTARMNVYTVRRATQGLADYINDCFGGGSVAVAYDTRHNSELFARETAAVLAANGIAVSLFGSPQPTPVLSFATRELGCTMGIMITASHNPSQYNGYKVFGSDGCQIGTADADAILSKIKATDIFDGVKTLPFEDAPPQGVLYINERLLTRYRKAVLDCSVDPRAPVSKLHVVYSPLHGTGLSHVAALLGDMGVRRLDIVECQKEPDGDFTTCEYPNPETREALKVGLDQTLASGADIFLATDPDADRVGVAVLHNNAMHVFTGNEIGVLLCDFVLRSRQKNKTLPASPVVVRSIVSTPLADAVAAKYGAQTRCVATGFKNIGEQILMLEQAGEVSRFVFGFEESCGYLAGSYVRDKDAPLACVLLCELAAECKKKGITLVDALEKIYTEHGRYMSETLNFSAEGVEGLESIRRTMRELRANPPESIGGTELLTAADYLSLERKNLLTKLTERLVAEPSDMLEWVLEDGSRLIIRPSGTEPKLKVYITVRGDGFDDANLKRLRLEVAVIDIVRL